VPSSHRGRDAAVGRKMVTNDERTKTTWDEPHDHSASCQASGARSVALHRKTCLILACRVCLKSDIGVADGKSRLESRKTSGVPAGILTINIRDRITKRYRYSQNLELVGLEFFLMIIVKDDYVFLFCTTVVFQGWYITVGDHPKSHKKFLASCWDPVGRFDQEDETR
jgi:hypothetical protein